MTNPDRLYDLLPAVHRLRDREQGYALRGLLRVIGEQVQIIEDDIQRLHDNWFIETCDDWVVPYIADLIGYDPVPEAGQHGDPNSARGALLNRTLLPRSEVANTIAFRRRKGTLALLELLADSVARWPARAVEFYRLVGWTQHVNHVRLDRAKTLDLRAGDALDQLHGAFESAARSVDVRRVSSELTRGRHNLPNVGLFVWRLRAYSVTRSPAYCLDRQPHCFTFSILGNDTPLFTRPEPETDPSRIAGELDVPAPIRRRAFGERGPERRAHASPRYYGEGKSLVLWTHGWPGEKEQELVAFPGERVIVADLTDFRYAPPAGHIALDPVLGRIAFPVANPPDKPVHVTYHYGFSADVGGGEYPRELEQPEGAEVFQVTGQAEWEACLAPWQKKAASTARPAGAAPRHHVIELMDSGLYEPPFRLAIPAGESLQIRAASGARPILFIPERKLHQLDDLSFTLGSGAGLTLDGLLIVNRGVTLRAEEGASLDSCKTRVTIRHSTLVPGWLLDARCEPLCPTEPSLVLFNFQGRVLIDRSIVGSIQVEHDEVREDPVAISVVDSVLDATGSDCDGPDCEAIGRLGRGIAHATLRFLRSTVIGRVRVHAIELGEDTIFTGRINVARSQVGCLRFCYAPPSSRTPRRYQCQPDLAERSEKEAVSRSKSFADSSESERAEALRVAVELARSGVRPDFASLRYGTPEYARLADVCAREIRRGASDESEMGVFHDLFEPQRAASLRARLAEYTPAAAEADLIFTS
jgi:hypothetical protein